MMKKIIFFLVVLTLSFCVFSEVSAKPGANKKVFFVHHSTGQIYWDNGMNEHLEENGYEGNAPWWDGSTGANNFPGLFNDSASWDIFEDSDIIMFKSCYPASAIGDDLTLENYKKWYRELYDVYEAHPDVLFIPMSTPPLPKDMTNGDEAKRAKKFDKWLVNKYTEEYTGNNLTPFRLHKLLRNKLGYLKKKYVQDPNDGHPAPESGEAVGQAIVEHLNKALE